MQTTWLKYFFLILYFADVANTLNAIRVDNRKYYAVTKSLLMPLLLAGYLCFLSPELRHASYQVFAILALCCHALGDIFLLFPKTKTKIYFYIGTVSFFAGHLFYIFWFGQKCWGHSTAPALVATAAVLILELYFLAEMTKVNKPMGLALVGYFLSLAALVAVVSSIFCGSTPTWKVLTALVGILIFWLSDYVIARREMKIKTLGQMFTMSAYITAQTFIVFAMYQFQR